MQEANPENLETLVIQKSDPDGPPAANIHRRVIGIDFSAETQFTSDEKDVDEANGVFLAQRCFKDDFFEDVSVGTLIFRFWMEPILRDNDWFR